jgi:Copine
VFSVSDLLFPTAIESVGEILARYDSDQKLPAFGVGAKLSPLCNKATDCFPLAGNIDPNCNMINGVLDAYRHTVIKV